jgi:hypothetical protein
MAIGRFQPCATPCPVTCDNPTAFSSLHIALTIPDQCQMDWDPNGTYTLNQTGPGYFVAYNGPDQLHSQLVIEFVCSPVGLWGLTVNYTSLDYSKGGTWSTNMPATGVCGTWPVQVALPVGSYPLTLGFNVGLPCTDIPANNATAVISA